MQILPLFMHPSLSPEVPPRWRAETSRDAACHRARSQERSIWHTDWPEHRGQRRLADLALNKEWFRWFNTSGYFKKQQCCALGWHLWQKCLFHRKMSELLIANHLAATLFSNFIQWQQISNRHNRKNKINPKHVIAYQTAALLGKNFQWKYGFVWELFRCLFQCTVLHELEDYIITSTH